MTYTLTKPFTFDQFIAQYGDEFRYELADGEIVDREPTGTHEAVGGKLAVQIGIAITNAGLPWCILVTQNLPASATSSPEGCSPAIPHSAFEERLSCTFSISFLVGVRSMEGNSRDRTKNHEDHGPSDG